MSPESLLFSETLGMSRMHPDPRNVCITTPPGELMCPESCIYYKYDKKYEFMKVIL